MRENRTYGLMRGRAYPERDAPPYSTSKSGGVGEICEGHPFFATGETPVVPVNANCGSRRPALQRLNLLNLLNLFVSFRAPRMRRFVCGEAKRPAGLAMEGLRRPTKSRQGAKPDSAKPTQVCASTRRLSCVARQRLPIPSILSILSHSTSRPQRNGQDARCPSRCKRRGVPIRRLHIHRSKKGGSLPQFDTRGGNRV